MLHDTNLVDKQLKVEIDPKNYTVVCPVCRASEGAEKAIRPAKVVKDCGAFLSIQAYCPATSGRDGEPHGRITCSASNPVFMAQNPVNPNGVTQGQMAALLALAARALMPQETVSKAAV